MKATEAIALFLEENRQNIEGVQHEYLQVNEQNGVSERVVFNLVYILAGMPSSYTTVCLELRNNNIHVSYKYLNENNLEFHKEHRFMDISYLRHVIVGVTTSEGIKESLYDFLDTVALHYYYKKGIGLVYKTVNETTPLGSTEKRELLGVFNEVHKAFGYAYGCFRNIKHLEVDIWRGTALTERYKMKDTPNYSRPLPKECG